MSSFVKFEIKELKKLINDKNSCVLEKRVKQKLALQPRCLGNLKESIKDLLDYKIGKYDKEHNGILLSYSNVRVLQNVGAIKNDIADIHFEVQIDYYIFKPFVGATLKGVVSKKCTTHLAIVVHRVFNVVIPRPTDEPGDSWIGTRVHEGQQVVFHIVVLDMFGALPYIRGELDESSLVAAEGDVAPIITKRENNLVQLDKTKPYRTQREISESTCSLKSNVKDPTSGESPVANGKANSMKSPSSTGKNKLKRQLKTSSGDFSDTSLKNPRRK